jgi:hypothetical protein
MLPHISVAGNRALQFAAHTGLCPQLVTSREARVHVLFVSVSLATSQVPGIQALAWLLNEWSAHTLKDTTVTLPFLNLVMCLYSFLTLSNTRPSKFIQLTVAYFMWLYFYCNSSYTKMWDIGSGIKNNKTKYVPGFRTLKIPWKSQSNPLPSQFQCGFLIYDFQNMLGEAS